MALVAVGTWGTATSNTSQSVWSFSFANTLNKGNIGIIIIAQDNEATADGQNTDIRRVGDSKGNTYFLARQFTNGQGAANGGATVSVWWTLATNDLTASDTIEVVLNSARTAKAATGWKFTIGGGNTLQVDDAVDLASDAVTAWGSLTSTPGTSVERIWLRATAQEWNVNTTWTVTAGFTKITAATGGGSTAAGMGAMGEFIIATATTQTSNPTGTIAASCDLASCMVALSEVAIPAGVTVPDLMLGSSIDNASMRM